MLGKASSVYAAACSKEHSISIQLSDLAIATELDHVSMIHVRGGNSSIAGLGPIANVNVGVIHNLTQLQNVEVHALNNVGSIGPKFTVPEIALPPVVLSCIYPSDRPQEAAGG